MFLLFVTSIVTLKEETFAVQENREIFTFRGNKLSRMTSYEKFRGNKLSRIWLKTAKPRKFLPLKYYFVLVVC